MAGEQTQRDRRPSRGCWSWSGDPCAQHTRAWPSWGSGPSPDRDLSPLGHPEDHRHEGLVDITTDTSQKASFTPLQIAPLQLHS